MIAVQRVNKFGSTRRFGHPVKNKTMGDVFKKSPEKHATKENQQYRSCSVIIFCSRRVNKKTKDGNVHPPYHQWVGFCQRLQEITLEQPGLALIMNFFEFHDAKIRNDAGGLNETDT